MTVERRDFIRVMAIGAVLPTDEVLDRAAGAANAVQAADLYDDAIVIDTLCVGREWGDEDFDAVKRSGSLALEWTGSDGTAVPRWDGYGWPDVLGTGGSDQGQHPMRRAGSASGRRAAGT